MVSLYDRIKTFYDDTSPLWEQVWGEHMHHGYYGPRGTERLDRRRAQMALMEALITWAVPPASPPPQRILDLGCGIGGSSLYLAQRYGAEVVGVSLSPYQVRRAQERARSAGLADRCQFQVANALDLPSDLGRFDWVWALESGEHIPHKVEFLQAMGDRLKPGGRFIMATWCHRPLNPGNGPLTPEEQTHLQGIYDLYHLPPVIGLPDYLAIAEGQGFKDIRGEDWSIRVAPFWGQVLQSVLEPQALKGLITAGPRLPQLLGGIRCVGLMQWGYDRGLIRFGVLTAVKPS